MNPYHHHAMLTFNFIYASAFFLGARFALGASPDSTVATFLEVALFNLAFIEFLLLDTPKEPFQRFPFFDFLSPRPMYKNNSLSKYSKPGIHCKISGGLLSVIYHVKHKGHNPWARYPG